MSPHSKKVLFGFRFSSLPRYDQKLEHRTSLIFALSAGVCATGVQLWSYLDFHARFYFIRIGSVMFSYHEMLMHPLLRANVAAQGQGREDELAPRCHARPVFHHILRIMNVLRGSYV